MTSGLHSEQGLASVASPGENRRAFGVALGAHTLHDGYTDLIYVMLPIWQAEFALTYAAIGLLRAVVTGTMACFQIPSGLLSERIGTTIVLSAGTALAGLCYCLAGASGGFPSLIIALFIGGLGLSTQHPIASSIVAHAYAGARSRAALGTYNFAGDIGKTLLPLSTTMLLALMPWRPALACLGLIGIAGAAAIFIVMPRFATDREHKSEKKSGMGSSSALRHGGFPLLLSIGVIDSATRMAFLTFLPFVLTAKGASVQIIGVALTLIFAGGAAGKLVCAWLGARLGVLATVWLSEGLTALGIIVITLLPLPLGTDLALMPIIGIALNGTSSVVYGTVPELVPAQARARAFSVFYTGTIGSGAAAPIIYGFIGDAIGITPTLMAAAGIVLITLPLSLALNRTAKLIGHI